MTKRPQSIYVDEVVHARVAQMIAYTSAGHGNLGGFFAFMEEKMYAEFGSKPADPRVQGFLSAAPAASATEDPSKKLQALASEQGIETSRHWLAYLATPLDDMPAYETAWSLAQPTLPWSDQAVAHVFALRLLAGRPTLWQTDPVISPTAPLNSDFRYGSFVHELIADFHNAGQGRSLPAGPPQVFVSFFPVAWRRGRVDFFPRDRQPRSAPTSFYLDSVAHAFVYNAFGNAFFTGAEAKLDRLLGDAKNWIDVTAEAQFLEHGAELLRLEQPYFDSPDESTLAALDQPFWQADRTQLGWVVDRHPSLRVAHGLGLDRARFDFTDGSRLAAEFTECYGLQALSPSVGHLYRVIQKRLTQCEWERTWSDPVEFHLYCLLQAYLRSVLPVADHEDARFDLRTTATLAQSWALPTTRALEAYGEADARKSVNGSWELVKGRKRLLTMTNAEAYQAMWVLWSTLPPLRAYQPYVDTLSDLFQALTGFDNWLEDEASENGLLAETLRTRDRFAFTTGPAVIADVLTCIRADRAEASLSTSPYRLEGFMAANGHRCTRRLRDRMVAEMLSKDSDTALGRQRSTK